MLRGWVLAAGIAMLVLAGLLFLSGDRNGGLVALAAWGVILAGGVYFERYRYKSELDRPPGPEWQATSERTTDAEGIVTVWYNPATGERAYVRARRGD